MMQQLLDKFETPLHSRYDVRGYKTDPLFSEAFGGTLINNIWYRVRPKMNTKDSYIISAITKVSDILNCNFEDSITLEKETKIDDIEIPSKEIEYKLLQRARYIFIQRKRKQYKDKILREILTTDKYDNLTLRFENSTNAGNCEKSTQEFIEKYDFSFPCSLGKQKQHPQFQKALNDKYGLGFKNMMVDLVKGKTKSPVYQENLFDEKIRNSHIREKPSL